MEDLEQENHELRGEVATLCAEMEKLTALVESLVAVQNQPSTTVAEIQTSTPVVSEIVTVPTFVTQINSPLQHQMPKGFPWGMPYNFVPEGYQPVVQPLVQPTMSFPQPETTTMPPVIPSVAPFPQPVMTIVAPVVHSMPYMNEPAYPAEPAESLGLFDIMEEFQDNAGVESDRSALSHLSPFLTATNNHPIKTLNHNPHPITSIPVTLNSPNTLSP